MASHDFEFPKRFDPSSRAATFQVADNRRRLSHSPLRHHRRAFSSGPHEVVETLNARTQYVDDEDGFSGTKQLNQCVPPGELCSELTGVDILSESNWERALMAPSTAQQTSMGTSL